MDADFHGGWTALDEVHASDREWVGALAHTSRFLDMRYAPRRAPQALEAPPPLLSVGDRCLNSHSPFTTFSSQNRARTWSFGRPQPPTKNPLPSECAPNSEPRPAASVTFTSPNAMSWGPDASRRTHPRPRRRLLRKAPLLRSPQKQRQHAHFRLVYYETPSSAASASVKFGRSPTRGRSIHTWSRRSASFRAGASSTKFRT